MQFALGQKRESYRRHIRRQKLRPIFENKRKNIIEESERAMEKECVAEEVQASEEQRMMLRGLHEQLTQQEKDHLLARLQTVQKERQANLFKLMVVQKAIRPDLSGLIVKIWRELQIVGDLTQCVRERLLRVDDNFSLQVILQRCLQSPERYFADYVSLFRLVVSFATEAEVARIINIVDQHLLRSSSAELGCVRLLNELLSREPSYSVAVFHMDSMDYLFRQCSANVEVFELCINVLLGCPEDIQTTVQGHPELIESTHSNMAVHASLDSRITAYTSLKAFVSTSESVKPYLTLVADICDRFQAEPTCLVKSKILDVVLTLLDHPDPLASRSFLEYSSLIQLAFNGLLVRNSAFVCYTIQIIQRAIVKQPNLTIHFVRHGLLQILDRIDQEFAENMMHQTQALRGMLDQFHKDAY